MPSYESTIKSFPVRGGANISVLVGIPEPEWDGMMKIVVDAPSFAVSASFRLDDPADMFNLYRAIGQALDRLAPGLISPVPDDDINSPARADVIEHRADDRWSAK